MSAVVFNPSCAYGHRQASFRVHVRVQGQPQFRRCCPSRRRYRRPDADIVDGPGCTLMPA